VGALSTPIVGGGNGTILDLDQPEFGISIPSGYTCIPLRLHVAAQIALLAADSEESEILIAADVAAKWAGDGTVTTGVPKNMRSNVSAACPLSTFSAATGDITDPVLGHELAHAVKIGDVQTAVGTTLTDLVLLYEPTRPPIFIGPAAIYGYWGGTVAASGFANLDFLAVPSTLFSDLT
jgi:hypothetical protein